MVKCEEYHKIRSKECQIKKRIALKRENKLREIRRREEKELER
jgi:hypothetical protein